MGAGQSVGSILPREPGMAWRAHTRGVHACMVQATLRAFGDCGVAADERTTRPVQHSHPGRNGRPRRMD